MHDAVLLGLRKKRGGGLRNEPWESGGSSDDIAEESGALPATRPTDRVRGAWLNHLHCARLHAIELGDNRRQRQTWEQAALDELGHGRPDTALAAYRQHDRIHTADTAEAVRQRLVHDWWDTASHDLAGSTMIALRRDDVAELNHRARAKMTAAGRLTGSTLATGGIELQAGDRIVCGDEPGSIRRMRLPTWSERAKGQWPSPARYSS